MHPKKPKGLSLGLGFQFVEYLGWGLGLGFFQIFCKFRIRYFKIKKNLIFGYGFEYKFRKTRKKIKIDTQIHTQKLNFFLYLNYLIRNLQKICKYLKPNPKPKYIKN